MRANGTGRGEPRTGPFVPSGAGRSPPSRNRGLERAAGTIGPTARDHDRAPLTRGVCPEGARSDGHDRPVTDRAHKAAEALHLRLGRGHRPRATATMKDLLGGKGAGLAEMTNAGLPTPPGFTITTAACNDYFEAGEQLPDGLWDDVLEAIKEVERRTGKGFGDASNPLLVSVRSGAKFSMPGMMDTVLNLGLNEETLHGLIALTGNERFGWDAYRRFIQMFGRIVMDVDGEPVRPRPRREEGRARREAGHGPERRGPARARRDVQGDRPRGHRSRLPDRPVRAARPRDQGRVRELVRQARPRLPQVQQDRRRPRHRGQRRDDGLRQHGRRLGHRRRVHPRPEHRRETSSTAST